MISSPAVITVSLFLLVPYSVPSGCITDMPSPSMLSQSLQKGDLLPIRGCFPASQQTYMFLKTVTDRSDVSAGNRAFVIGLRFGAPDGPQRQVNGREKRHPHSPCFCHL